MQLDMEAEEVRPTFLKSIGSMLLRGVVAVGAGFAYAVLLLLLAAVGGPFNKAFTAINVFLLVAAAVWVVAPLFKFMWSKFGNA